MEGREEGRQEDREASGVDEWCGRAGGAGQDGAKTPRQEQATASGAVLPRRPDLLHPRHSLPPVGLHAHTHTHSQAPAVVAYGRAAAGGVDGANAAAADGTGLSPELAALATAGPSLYLRHAGVLAQAMHLDPSAIAALSDAALAGPVKAAAAAQSWVTLTDLPRGTTRTVTLRAHASEAAEAAEEGTAPIADMAEMAGSGELVLLQADGTVRLWEVDNDATDAAREGRRGEARGGEGWSLGAWAP